MKVNMCWAMQGSKGLMNTFLHIIQQPWKRDAGVPMSHVMLTSLTDRAGVNKNYKGATCDM